MCHELLMWLVDFRKNLTKKLLKPFVWWTVYCDEQETAKFGVLVTRENEAKPQIVISESQIIRVLMIHVLVIDRYGL